MGVITVLTFCEIAMTAHGGSRFVATQQKAIRCYSVTAHGEPAQSKKSQFNMSLDQRQQ
jgi:hypothetical protein